uniref:RNA polymerase sigma-70 factor n=2 Tax=unclassified Prevotella TaxID=2638335 RepID=A0AB33JJQ4_9BACT
MKTVAIHMSDEKQIIIELKQGSSRALHLVYELYAKRLCAFCVEYTKSVEDAEEIVEDVFVKLWDKRETIRQEDSLKSLLFVMSRRMLINAYRARVHSVSFADYVEMQDVVDEGGSERQLNYDDFMRQLERNLQKLPLTQQRIIRMSRLEDMPNREIAKVLNLSEQTVKNQLSIGLQVLRRKLGKYSLLATLLLYVN